MFDEIYTEIQRLIPDDFDPTSPALWVRVVTVLTVFVLIQLLRSGWTWARSGRDLSPEAAEIIRRLETCSNCMFSDDSVTADQVWVACYRKEARLIGNGCYVWVAGRPGENRIPVDPTLSRADVRQIVRAARRVRKSLEAEAANRVVNDKKQKAQSVLLALAASKEGDPKDKPFRA